MLSGSSIQLILRKLVFGNFICTGLLNTSIKTMALLSPSAISYIPSMPLKTPSATNTFSPGVNSGAG